MNGTRLATALASAFLAVAPGSAFAQHYYPPPPPGYDGGVRRLDARNALGRPRVALSRVCASADVVCYLLARPVGEQCACGVGWSLATGAIVPE